VESSKTDTALCGNSGTIHRLDIALPGQQIEEKQLMLSFPRELSHAHLSTSSRCCITIPVMEDDTKSTSFLK
jgi:hypothetical protein